MRITHLYTDPEQLSSSKTKKAKVKDKRNGKTIKHYCMFILRKYYCMYVTMLIAVQ